MCACVCVSYVCVCVTYMCVYVRVYVLSCIIIIIIVYCFSLGIIIAR